MSEIFQNIPWLELINSPAGISAAAFILVVILNKIYAAKPAWAAFEGTLITAIKFAEKAIDDDTENKGAKRFDKALQYVLEVYKKTHRGKLPGRKAYLEIKEGIQIVHADLEDRDILK